MQRQIPIKATVIYDHYHQLITARTHSLPDMPRTVAT